MKFPTLEEIAKVISIGFPTKPQGTYPTTGEPVWLFSQGFGENKDRGLYDKWGHKGEDVLVGSGTPIYAQFDGVVSEVDEYVCGKYVRIKGNVHKTEDGQEFFLESLDLHLSEQLVRVNQRMKEGDLIAKSGNTGYPACSTGPHDHTGIRLYTKRMDGKWELWPEALGYINPATLRRKPNISRYRKGAAMVLYSNGIPLMEAIKAYDKQNIKGDQNPDVYFVEYGQKRKYPDEATMWAHGHSTRDCIIVEQAVLDEVPTGKDMDLYEGLYVDALKQIFYEVGEGNAKTFFDKYFA